jgi:hypothetical protein
MTGLARKVLGWSLVAVGLMGLVLPVIPGVVPLVAGAAILGVDVTGLRRIWDRAGAWSRRARLKRREGWITVRNRRRLKSWPGWALVAVGLAVGTALAGEAVGKIQKIDMDQKMLVLEDGTQLWLAEGADTGKLKEGAKVKLSYAERDGKKWITGVEVVSD